MGNRMPENRKWYSYYWELLGYCGAESYRTWRGEMLAGVVILVAIYALTPSHQGDVWENFVIALKGTVIGLGLFGLWHLIRAPWLIERNKNGKEPKPHRFFGFFGLAIIVGIILGSTLEMVKLYRAHQVLLVNNKTLSQANQKLTEENAKIKTMPSKGQISTGLKVNQSLKQRTLLLANRIQEFAEEKYPSSVVMDTNSGLTEQERQAQQKKYDGEIAAQFQRKFYRETRQLVGEFKAKGIYVTPTESLLSQQPKETRTGPWFVELIKDLRSLASEIDDTGKLIQ